MHSSYLYILKPNNKIDARVDAQDRYFIFIYYVSFV